MKTSTTRSRGRFTIFTTAAVMTIIGAGCSGSGEDRSAPSPLDSFVPAQRAEVPSFDAPAAPFDASPTPPADDPVGAVRQYLDGEVAGEFEQSYTALSNDSRGDAGSLGDWAETATERPTIVRFEIDPAADESPAGGSSVTVTGQLTLDPRLDEVSGFVPQRAAVEWQVVAEDGGWRLDLADSAVRPVLPDEREATAAAERWARARQQCRVEGEYDGSLLGSPALAEDLCGREGAVVAGPPAPLDDSIGTQVVAAFGPDALTWARTVPISGVAELSVVTAPYGDGWVVVGVTR